jgi:hypothetical protein
VQPGTSVNRRQGHAPAPGAVRPFVVATPLATGRDCLHQRAAHAIGSSLLRARSAETSVPPSFVSRPSPNVLSREFHPLPVRWEWAGARALCRAWSSRSARRSPAMPAGHLFLWVNYLSKQSDPTHRTSFDHSLESRRPVPFRGPVVFHPLPVRWERAAVRADLESRSPVPVPQSRPTPKRGQGSGHQFRGSSTYQRNVTRPDPPDESVPSHRVLVCLRPDAQRWQDLPPFLNEVVPSHVCTVSDHAQRNFAPNSGEPPELKLYSGRGPPSALTQRRIHSFYHADHGQPTPSFHARGNNFGNSFHRRESRCGAALLSPVRCGTPIATARARRKLPSPGGG